MPHKGNGRQGLISTIFAAAAVSPNSASWDAFWDFVKNWLSFKNSFVMFGSGSSSNYAIMKTVLVALFSLTLEALGYSTFATYEYFID